MAASTFVEAYSFSTPFPFASTLTWKSLSPPLRFVRRDEFGSLDLRSLVLFALVNTRERKVFRLPYASKAVCSLSRTIKNRHKGVFYCAG